jgi:predicted Zn-dependent peptidase
MYQVTRLENGLTVATAEMPHMASVSLGIWVGVGGRYEPAPFSGVSHFIEHLLVQGHQAPVGPGHLAGGRGHRRLPQRLYQRGAHLLLRQGAPRPFRALLDVLTDMFLHSTFDPVEIDKEREVIKEELAMYMDQPQQYVQELLNDHVARSALGPLHHRHQKTLDAIGREQLLDYQKQNYVAPATLLAAGGRITHREAVAAAAKYARKFARGRAARCAPAVSTQTKAGRALVEQKDRANADRPGHSRLFAA